MPRELARDRRLILRTVNEHHALVYSLALGLTRNMADAEDLAQEVFLRVIRHVDKLRDARQPKAWLAQVTMNAGRSYLRSQAKRQQREEAWAMQRREFETPRDMTDAEAVREALGSLPDELRIPVMLHYQQGFKYREIAEILECPQGTVATRVSTAKARLRERLGVAGGGAASFEASLASSSPPAPAGLSTRLIEAVESEFRRLGYARPLAQAIAITIASIAALLLIGWGVHSAVFADREAADVDRTSARLRSGLDSRDPIGPPDAATDDLAIESVAGTGAQVPEPVVAVPTPSVTTVPVSGYYGFVIDPTGEPISNARVELTNAGQHASTTTDESGYYTLALPAPITASTSEDDGDESQVTAQKVRLDADLAARREAELRASYEPMRAMKEAATALASNKAPVQREAIVQRLKEVAEAASATDLEKLREMETELAQAKVQAELAALEDYLDTAKLVASASAYVSRRHRAPVIDVDESARIDFQLTRASELGGQIVDRDGGGIAGAKVTIVGRVMDDSALSQDDASSATDDEGYFSFGAVVGDGQYILRVSADGYVDRDEIAATGDFAVIEMTQAATLVVEIPPKPTVELQTGDEREILLTWMSPRRLRVLVDGRHIKWISVKHGTNIASFSPGRYTIQYYAGGQSAQLPSDEIDVSLVGGESVTVEPVVDLARLSGEVHLADGAGVPRGHRLSVGLNPLDCVRLNDSPINASVDGTGHFRFKGVPVGRYSLTLVASRGKLTDTLIAVREVRIGDGVNKIDWSVEAAPRERVEVSVIASDRPEEVTGLCQLFDSDGLGLGVNAMARSESAPAVMYLPAGRYSIVAISSHRQASPLRDFAVGREPLALALRLGAPSPAVDELDAVLDHLSIIASKPIDLDVAIDYLTHVSGVSIELVAPSLGRQLIGTQGNAARWLSGSLRKLDLHCHLRGRTVLIDE